MKVSYEVKNEVNIKDIKELIKPFGGRCAKYVDGKLEYQIKEEEEAAAREALTSKEII